MNKNTMIKNYRRFSGADSYIVGFPYKGELYMIQLDEIAPRYMVESRKSSKNGGGKTLKMNLTNPYKEQLIRKGAICLGSAEQLNSDLNNKGFTFEALVYEYFGQPFKGRDNMGFWTGGDIEINGKQIQIKTEKAMMVAEDTLENLKMWKRWGYDLVVYSPGLMRTEKRKRGIA